MFSSNHINASPSLPRTFFILTNHINASLSLQPTFSIDEILFYSLFQRFSTVPAQNLSGHYVHSFSLMNIASHFHKYLQNPNLAQMNEIKEDEQDVLFEVKFISTPKRWGRGNRFQGETKFTESRFIELD